MTGDPEDTFTEFVASHLTWQKGRLSLSLSPCFLLVKFDNLDHTLRGCEATTPVYRRNYVSIFAPKLCWSQTRPTTEGPVLFLILDLSPDWTDSVLGPYTLLSKGSLREAPTTPVVFPLKRRIDRRRSFQ